MTDEKNNHTLSVVLRTTHENDCTLYEVVVNEGLNDSPTVVLSDGLGEREARGRAARRLRALAEALEEAVEVKSGWIGATASSPDGDSTMYVSSKGT